MQHLDKKIEEYSEELFADLGLTAWPEERKADIYARLQEHFHRAILDTVTGTVKPKDLEKIHEALDQEVYEVLDDVLKNYSLILADLPDKIEQEYNNLKLIIAEEQKNAGSTAGAGKPAARI